MKHKVEKIFFALLRFEIAGVKLSDDVKNLITDDLLPSLFKLSKIHDLAHLIGDALDKNGLLIDGSNAQKFFIKERNLAIFRYERIKYEYDLIVKTLEQSGTKFVPLKGSVIRKYYPEPWMRTSCDIDILVKEAELDDIAKMLCETLGYSCPEQRTVNELSLFSSTGVHLELHYDLTEGDNYGKNILSNIWDYTIQKEGLNECELIDPVFYFYHIAHMVKHFENGGCGVRFFLDLWLLNKDDKYIVSEREKYLKIDNLLQFANACENLSEIWFDEKQIDDLSVRLQDYILSGGVYGSLKNRVNVQQAKKGGKFKYILSRVFISKSKLQVKYPRLKKQPYLLPFYTVKRWFNLLFTKERRADALNELSRVNSLDTTESSYGEKLMSDLGLND